LETVGRGQRVVKKKKKEKEKKRGKSLGKL
jgi:hypothetical protein